MSLVRKLVFSSDKQYIVKKCPYLINEMVNIVAQLVALAHGGRGKFFFCWEGGLDLFPTVFAVQNE